MSNFKCQINSKDQNSNYRNRSLGLGFICFFLFLLISGCKSEKLYRETQVMMGTFVEVVSPDARAPKIAFDEIKKIENLLSNYQEDSEVSRLNSLGKLGLSEETFYIIKRAGDFYHLSQGAFDITVAPLVELWGFKDKKYHLPDPQDIKKTLKLVGFEKINFDSANNVVEFKFSGMKIDLGAIAKGYAVDCAVAALKKAGINNALVNAGGDIFCLGYKFEKPWQVAIQNPRGKGMVEYLKLINQAVATSGDYEQYFNQDNKRYSHIFNPKTGYPASSGVISVTVIAPDCLTADALATSIMVLGRDKGQGLANTFSGVKVKIIDE